MAEATGVLRVQPTWLANLANIYLARRQFAQALPYAERSLTAARRLGDSRKVATSLSNLALVQIELGRYDSAARLNEEASAIWRTLDDRRNERYALLNAAQIDAATGHADRAVATLAAIDASPTSPPPERRPRNPRGQTETAR